MPELKVELSNEEWEMLVNISAKKNRSPEDQAALFIVRGILNVPTLPERVSRLEFDVRRLMIIQAKINTLAAKVIEDE